MQAHLRGWWRCPSLCIRDMNVYDWYLKLGGTFLYCQVDGCGRRFRKYSRFRRHMNRKHLERE